MAASKKYGESTIHKNHMTHIGIYIGLGKLYYRFMIGMIRIFIRTLKRMNHDFEGAIQLFVIPRSASEKDIGNVFLNLAYEYYKSYNVKIFILYTDLICNCEVFYNPDYNLECVEDADIRFGNTDGFFLEILYSMNFNQRPLDLLYSRISRSIYMTPTIKTTSSMTMVIIIHTNDSRPPITLSDTFIKSNSGMSIAPTFKNIFPHIFCP